MSDLLGQLEAALGGAYHFERELGGGGMSRVFLAHETALGRKVVIKVLPPELSAGLSIDRFRREIQLAASLQHPHIVPLLAAGQASDALPLLYYTMPLVEGESLRARLIRQHELPIGEAIRLLRDVVDALACAHEHGVVHRDIKPDNVLVSRQHAMVTDFGVAKALESGSGEQRLGGALTSLGVALGHAGLYGARAGRCRSACRSPRRHLCGGRTRVRNADRSASLHRAFAAGDSGGSSDAGAAAYQRPAPDSAAGAGRARDALPREKARRPVAERRRGAAPSGVDGDAERRHGTDRRDRRGAQLRHCGCSVGPGAWRRSALAPGGIPGPGSRARPRGRLGE